MFLTESLLLQYSQHKPAYNDEEKVLKLRLNDPELRCSHKDSLGLLTIKGISQNSQDEAKQKCKVKLQKSFTKKLSNLKTTAQSRRLKSNARKGSDSGDVTCPQLLTHNEDDKVSLDINSSSSVNYQTYVNSGLSTALPAYGSDNVSLDINSTSYIPKDADLPRVVLCLAHNGKVVWDVKWQPCNAPPSKCQHRMSYLVVLLGNGCLEVWDVPLPHAMKSVYSSSNLEGIDPRFVKIKPVFRCSTLNCGGFQRDSDLKSSLSYGIIWFAVYGGSREHTLVPCLYEWREVIHFTKGEKNNNITNERTATKVLSSSSINVT